MHDDPAFRIVPLAGRLPSRFLLLCNGRGGTMGLWQETEYVVRSLARLRGSADDGAIVLA
jgi:hypothetical protein